MTSARHDKSQGLIHLGIVAGLVAGVLYPVSMLNLLPGGASDFAFMWFGPAFAAAALGMRAFYARANDTATNDLAHLLLILAGLAFTLMATTQMSIYRQIPDLYRGSLEPGAATWDAILKSVSSTQLGLDYAFDVFVSAGIILLGWQMIRHPRVPSILGVLGILVGVAGLTVNTLTFPENSGLAGLVDPAPAFGIWFSLAWLPLLLLRKWRPQGDPQ